MKYLTSCLWVLLIAYTLSPAPGHAGTDALDAGGEPNLPAMALTPSRVVFELSLLRNLEYVDFINAQTRGLSGGEKREKNRQLMSEYPPDFLSGFQSAQDYKHFENRIGQELSNFMDRYAQNPSKTVVRESAAAIVELYVAAAPKGRQSAISGETVELLRNGMFDLLNPKSVLRGCGDRLIR